MSSVEDTVSYEPSRYPGATGFGFYPYLRLVHSVSDVA